MGESEEFEVTNKAPQECYKNILVMGKEEIALVGDPSPKLVADTDIWDPRLGKDNERLTPTEDLKEVWIGPSTHQVTKIGISLNEEEARELVGQLTRNNDLFIWASLDMSKIDTRVTCHFLVGNPYAKSVE